MTLVALTLIVGLAADPQAAAQPQTPAEAAAQAQAPAGGNPQEKAPEEKKTPEEKEPVTPPHTGIRALAVGVLQDFKHVPTLPNLYITAALGGAALAAHDLDRDVNTRLRGHENAATPIFAAGKYIGQTPVQVSAALATYAYGRLRDEKKVSHFGMDLLRAQIVCGAMTAGLKYATQRERPDQSNNHSFPSGHASVTFATATVIERHLGWKSSALGYTVASYVAASRLHDNRHWLSDVVFGSAVGIVSGRAVTEHGRQTWTLMPAAVPGGVAIMAARVTP